MTTLVHATTVQRLSFDELVSKASSIIVGKVDGSRTFWSGKLILTTYTLEVDETLKGQPSRTIELTTIGGTIGTVMLHVSGMPTFEKGENAVVFVEKSGAFSTIVGLGQGKFTVVNGEVSNNTAGLTFPDGRPGRSLKIPLDSFRNQIRSIAGR